MGTATINKQRSKAGSYFLLLSFSCLTLSLLVHFFFFEKAKRWEMAGFSAESYDTIVPRTFRMKRVEIDPKTLESENLPVPKEKEKKVPVPLENENPQMDQSPLVTAGKSILVKPQENPPIENPDAKTPTQGLDDLLSKAETAKISTLKGELPKSTESDLALGSEEAMKLPDLNEKELVKGLEKSIEAKSDERGTPKFSSLDDLLATSGTVKSDTAPILMPTDLLFEYDSDVLKPAAAQSLTKLGSLIKRNARASFRIEGHTDSFGTDEYNMQLSLRRAEAVKNWLITNMGIDPTRISTIGLGKTRLLVPGTGNVEQQKLNRRVEIVISVPK